MKNTFFFNKLFINWHANSTCYFKMLKNTYFKKINIPSVFIIESHSKYAEFHKLPRFETFLIKLTMKKLFPKTIFSYLPTLIKLPLFSGLFTLIKYKLKSTLFNHKSTKKQFYSPKHIFSSFFHVLNLG